MSEFSDLLNTIDSNTNITEQKLDKTSEISNTDESSSEIEEVQLQGKYCEPFDISLFSEEIKDFSETKNRIYSEVASNINAYDIAHNCISHVVKKLLKYPVKSFSTSWLPILMRSTIGTAVHNFIQDHTKQFTETEVGLKIPSIRFSGKIDGVMGYNVLNEIKSCTYDDYRKIIKNRRPRPADFYQTLTYKYVIENYLEEAKQQEAISSNGSVRNLPKLNEYKIDKLQYIYVAHNILSDDVEDLGQCLKNIKHIKQVLNSKHDQFYFISSIVLNVNDFDYSTFENMIKTKIERINDYVNSNKLPTIKDEFVDTNKCFFCLYRHNCELR